MFATSNVAFEAEKEPIFAGLSVPIIRDRTQASRSTTKTTRPWAWRMFRSVCVPHGVSTVRGRGGAAPEAGVHGVAN